MTPDRIAETPIVLHGGAVIYPRWRGFLATAVAVCGSVLLGSVSEPASAQGKYPARPIRVVVPYTPGGITDVATRMVMQEVAKPLGQNIIVDNRPGANSIVGAEIVAKSIPDGYTLASVIAAHAANQTLYPKLPYDAIKSFAPVSLLVTAPLIVCVTNSLPVKTPKELIDLAKAKPGELTFASSGSGTSIHLSGELFKSMAGIQMTHIPYKGSGPMLIDLMSGTTSMAFDNLSASIAHIKAGKLKALATTGPQRAPALPDLPTISEAGLTGYDSTSWNAVYAPAGTPKEIVDRLNRELRAILESPETKKFFAEQGAEAGGGTPQQLDAFMRAETTKWAKVVKESGAKVD
jgi:tripartite-type tricarboxylate transporter receptor subunit TctC